MTILHRTVLFALVATFGLIEPAIGADWICYRQSLQFDGHPNHTIVNDLHLDFTRKLEPKNDGEEKKPRLWHAGLDANNNGINESGERVRATNLPDDDEATWTQNSFGVLTPNHSVDIDFCVKKGGKMDLSRSFWTEDGAVVEAPISTGRIELGKDINLSDVAMTFENPGVETIVFTDITGWTGNDMSRFMIDDFADPTGTQVFGLPTSVILAPGEEQTFFMGLSEFDGYQMVTATAALLSDPTNTFAWTAAIPEPAALSMLSLGAAACLRRTRRR